MLRSSASELLAGSVEEGKRWLKSGPAGSFLIDEFGHVLVPSANERRRALVGTWSGPLYFSSPFDGAVFELYDQRGLQAGQAWSRPYVGSAYQLSARNELYFWREDDQAAGKELPPIQDQALVLALRVVRPRGPVRFVVGCGGIVLTKVPKQMGKWMSVEDDWSPRYVGQLNFAHWFVKED